MRSMRLLLTTPTDTLYWAESPAHNLNRTDVHKTAVGRRRDISTRGFQHHSPRHQTIVKFKEPSRDSEKSEVVPEMKASLKCKYDSDKNSAATTVAVGAGAVKLRASMTDATFVNGPSLTGLVLGVEKPGFFILDYNVPKKDFRFQFMNTVRVAEKPLNLTYIHSKGDNRTILDGSLVLDSANKVSANHMLGSGNCKFKYTYVHKGATTFEPCYDWAKDSWDFAMSHKVYGDDVFRAAYQTSSKVLGLEWSRNSKFNGSFKFSTSLNLAEELRVPNVSAETTWNFDM